MILFWVSMLSIGFVAAKASYELIQTSNGQSIDGDVIHSNQHLVYLICIIMYETINVLSYGVVYSLVQSYEDLLSTHITEHIQWLLFIRIQFLNLIFLLIINHFKQERTNTVSTVHRLDIFKF